MILRDNRLLNSHSWQKISAERPGKLFSSLPPGAENLHIPDYHKKSKKNLSLSIYTWYIFTQPVCIGYSHLLEIILSSEYTSENENGIALTFPDLTVVDANSSLNKHVKKSPQVGYYGMHLVRFRIKGNMKYFHKVLRQGGFM